MSFCKNTCPWMIRQSKQWSTWRGLMIGATTIATAINPAAGLLVGKICGGIIGTVEVIKNDAAGSR